jgi:potassium-transporting ATPase KdpC subunit
MMRLLRASLVILVLMTLLTGVAYPLAMTGVAHLFLREQANGSLLMRDGKVVGSALIGQSFSSDRYFHGRPSATTDTDPADATKTVPAPYNAANSAGSNLAPTSKALVDRVKEDVTKLGGGPSTPVPADLVTTSASGLDPDISPASAELQVARIAKVRGVPDLEIRRLVAQHTEGRMFGVLGEPRVNVLQLNLALDAAHRQ